ncbi:ubiquinone/menaquinone biosynthesis C-methylase UbiE [Isoptericola jiangsuensis]|uniref:Ubiquinone/menaquinone biosynthesis C-methylase UbiE n=1 Tax=Isoptericola jiangsuensis TaxID=548579 RepID=A0A2A9EWY7_9MICO|nr:methyltransferase domain-containing protein [Isoptericola jiangsuensis]PFG42689.1 ubiquinone/menaquinone biosynthesis C-methylase UbiE [Isoptericola jiangsuensis]
MLRKRSAADGPVEVRGGRLADEFDRAADRYDLLTRLNPGYHRALLTAARDLVSRLPRRGGGEPLVLWDLGCGSGLSTRALLDAAGEDADVVGLDASGGMLSHAEAKPWPEGVRFVQAFAQDLPKVAREQGRAEADGAFAAYLLRNVPEEQRDDVVAAIRDQVRPGGWIALQDYHVKGRRVSTAVWTAVCWGVVMPLSVIVRGNPAIYRYLWRSVVDNDSTTQLEARLERAGLTDVRWRTGTGWQRGILHTVMARRPDADPA